MNILQRYIAANMVGGWLLVTLVLAAVFGLLGFIQELDQTRLDYSPAAAARYTLLILPQQLVSLAPVIALLGSIVALANLDRFNELTVISCAGVSIRKLLAAIALPTLALMLLLWAGMEYVTAPMHRSAEQQRLALRHGSGLPFPENGVWSRHGHRYVHLGEMLDDSTPGDIALYEFDGQGRLVLALHAQTAAVGPDRHWLLEDVREKAMTDSGFRTRHLPTLEVANLWAPDELPNLMLSSDSLPLSVLYGYGRHLLDDDQAASRHRSAFWQKLILPFTVAAMVLLATPICVNSGSRRDRNLGVNMGIGALVGILFYLGAQIVFALGQLLDINAAAVVLAPTLAVLLCALLLLRRMRW